MVETGVHARRGRLELASEGSVVVRLLHSPGGIRYRADVTLVVRDVEVGAAVRGIDVASLEKDRLQLVVLEYQVADVFGEMFDGKRNAVLPVCPSLPAKFHTVSRITVGSVVPQDVGLLVFLMAGLSV